MDLAAVMDELGDALEVIAGLRVYRWPPDSVSVPAAIVGMPDTVTFDQTYRRGMDRMTVPIVLVVSKGSARAARDQLGAYCNGSGPQSIKAAVQSHSYSALHTARVQNIEFDVITIGTGEYSAAMFDVDVTGQGT